MTNNLKYYVANWKMHGDLSSISVIRSIEQYLKKNKIKLKKVIACVPNTLLIPFSTKLKSSRILLGAQDCHFREKHGPYTGSSSAQMLKKAGAKYVIIGHSETRNKFTTNKILKKKIMSALNQNLNVIYCVGEKFIEKKKGKTQIVLKQQLLKVLNKKIKLNKIIIAYEPVWSIGSGNIPKAEDLKKIIAFIRKILKKIKSNYYPKILYGGSVKKENIGIFSSIDQIDGFLVGGASLSSKKFIDILKNSYI